jgi:hypothetical protein
VARDPDRDFFISHTASESSFAQALSKALSARGLHAWAPEKLNGGHQSAEKIGHALRAARWYVVLISESALSSPNVNFEIGAALAGQKKMLPVFLSKRARRKAHAPLRHFKGILAEGLSPKDIADRVAQAIEKEAA